MGASAVVSVHVAVVFPYRSVADRLFPDSNRDRVWAVYGASKTQGEQAAWQFVKENKPNFTVNTVLPNANFGPVSRAQSNDELASLSACHHGPRSSMPSSSQPQQQAGSEPSWTAIKEV